MTADVATRMERIRMALAEAGYPGYRVHSDHLGIRIDSRREIPPEIVHRALALASTAAGKGSTCFPCWLRYGNSGASDKRRLGREECLRRMAACRDGEAVEHG